MPDTSIPLRVVGEALGEARGETAPVPGGLPQGLQRLDSRVLFQGSREVVIHHEGADYRLRLTSNGKLILTK
ncbi:hemin uptake protein HemP [Ferrovibrio xuzhouensis]|uniref:Hemin uptake protein HemP n=1 Tax=Ferrovibrio xuzhouensis TaxID=1576914 RepID=A0ABV7VDQ0_9PROT